MLRRVFAACILLVIAPVYAFADPSGFFDISGHNANGGLYKGTVEIARVGETYRISWKIGNEAYVGTGIGARVDPDKGYQAGAARQNDNALTVAFISGKAFGAAQFLLQADGSWLGKWTIAGSEKVLEERWIPRTL